MTDTQRLINALHAILPNVPPDRIAALLPAIIKLVESAAGAERRAP